MPSASKCWWRPLGQVGVLVVCCGATSGAGVSTVVPNTTAGPATPAAFVNRIVLPRRAPGSPDVRVSRHEMAAKLEADGRVEVTIAAGTGPLMTRAGVTLSASAERLLLMADPTGFIVLERRSATSSAEVARLEGAKPMELPVRLRLDRVGTRVLAHARRPSDEEWRLVDAVQWIGDAPLEVGVEVDGRDPDAAHVARFEGLSLRRPRGGRAHRLPGAIPAHLFDDGDGVETYRDADSDNKGYVGSYAKPFGWGPVDVQQLEDGRYAVANTFAGEWVEYYVDVSETGMYDLSASVASGGCGGALHLEVDGNDATGPMLVPNTDGWLDWGDLEPRKVRLEAGPHVIRIAFDRLGFGGLVASVVEIRAVPMGSASKASPSISLPPLTVAHPRLFVTPNRLEEVRAAIKVPGTHHRLAYDALKARVDARDPMIYSERPEGDDGFSFARAWLAREAAFVYQVTDDKAYALLAFEMLRAIYDDPGAFPRVLEGDGHNDPKEGLLSRAMLGFEFAIVFDWCHNAWSSEQREFIRGKLTKALAEWPCWYATSLAAPFMRNWVGVCRGAELVMMLALQQEREQPERYERLKGYLDKFIERAYGPTGLTGEGILYSNYAGNYALPALFALRSVGDTELQARLESRSWWRLLMSAGSFSERHPFVQTGVDLGDELVGVWSGWASLLFATVPAADLPDYKWFYDHAVGVSSGRTGTDAFDGERAGATWSLLYYPEQIVARDPNTRVARTIADPVIGTHFFRNRWKDRDDIIVAVTSDAQPARSVIWNRAVAFGLSLNAFDTRFIGSHGKLLFPTDGFSAILVDGKPEVNRWDTGRTELYEPGEDGGGYVVIDGGEKYLNLGLTSAKRHVSVDFPGRGDAGLISVLDHLAAKDVRLLTWQLNLGGEDDDGGILASRADEGVPTFVLKAQNGAFLKGWVLSPAGAELNADDPVQVNVRAGRADIWVAMVVGKGTPPKGIVTGAGLDSTLVVNDQRISYDRTKERMVTR